MPILSLGLRPRSLLWALQDVGHIVGINAATANLLFLRLASGSDQEIADEMWRWAGEPKSWKPPALLARAAEICFQLAAEPPEPAPP